MIHNKLKLYLYNICYKLNNIPFFMCNNKIFFSFFY